MKRRIKKIIDTTLLEIEIRQFLFNHADAINLDEAKKVYTLSADLAVYLKSKYRIARK